MDGRINNGGKREGAGRKPKDAESKLIERLDACIDQEEAIEILKNKMHNGDMRALQLYFNYRYGKPKESVEVSSEGFNLNFRDLVKFD